MPLYRIVSFEYMIQYVDDKKQPTKKQQQKPPTTIVIHSIHAGLRFQLILLLHLRLDLIELDQEKKQVENWPHKNVQFFWLWNSLNWFIMEPDECQVQHEMGCKNNLWGNI